MEINNNIEVNNMNGITVGVRLPSGEIIDGKPVGLQLLGDKELMTVKIPNQKELVAMTIPAGWAFSTDRGWYLSWMD